MFWRKCAPPAVEASGDFPTYIGLVGDQGRFDSSAGQNSVTPDSSLYSVGDTLILMHTTRLLLTSTSPSGWDTVAVQQYPSDDPSASLRISKRIATGNDSYSEGVNSIYHIFVYAFSGEVNIDSATPLRWSGTVEFPSLTLSAAKKARWLSVYGYRITGELSTVSTNYTLLNSRYRAESVQGVGFTIQSRELETDNQSPSSFSGGSRYGASMNIALTT
jgi:hypothetical protein